MLFNFVGIGVITTTLVQWFNRNDTSGGCAAFGITIDGLYNDESDFVIGDNECFVNDRNFLIIFKCKSNIIWLWFNFKFI